MKIAIISDIHIGCRNDSSIFNDYFIKYFNDIFFPYLEKNNIDTIIHLGDVFDRRKYINFLTWKTWRTNFFNILNEKYNTYILQGNHDIYYRSTSEVTSLEELLLPFQNIHIITKPEIIKFNNTEILFLPWVNESNENEIKKLLEDTPIKIVFGHFEIIGFDMYRGVENIDKGFSKDIFKKFNLVLSGHYHHKSQKDNIYYVGSPYEMIWSDYNDERGFHIFDLNSKTLNFIKNNNNIFKKIYYNDSEYSVDKYSQNKIVDKLCTTISANFNNYKNCYVKIIIEKKINQNLFDQFLEKLYYNNPADVSIIDLNDSQSIIENIDESKDTLTLLIEYVNSLNITNKEKNSLSSVLKDVYLMSQKIDI